MMYRQTANLSKGHAFPFNPLQIVLAFSQLLGTYYYLVQRETLNLAVGIVGLLGTLWGLWTLGKSSYDKKSLFVCLVLVPWFGIIGMSLLSIQHIFYYRYLLICAPYTFIVLALALSKMSKPVIATTMSAWLVLNLGFWFAVLTQPGLDREDWRATAGYLKSQLANGDLVVSENLMTLFPFWYYLPGQLTINYFQGLFAFQVKPGENRIQWFAVKGETPLQEVQERCVKSKRQWLVLCEEKWVDPLENIPRWFFANQRPVSSRSFPSLEPGKSIRVLLFEGRNAP